MAIFRTIRGFDAPSKFCMPGKHAPAPPESGRFLVVVVAILVLAFFVLVFWGTKHGTSSPPAPVRSSQPEN